MFSLLRLTTIVLALLAFAVVLTICGEAFACGSCVHTCCVKTDRAERREDPVVAQLVKSYDCVPQAAHAGAVVARTSLLGRTASPPTPPVLVAKTSQLRI